VGAKGIADMPCLASKLIETKQAYIVGAQRESQVLTSSTYYIRRIIYNNLLPVKHISLEDYCISCIFIKLFFTSPFTDIMPDFNIRSNLSAF